MKMGEFSRKDFISDLPQSILDSVLTKLPIRDVVRTSILSTKWRYQWTTLTQLVFDENCVSISEDKKDAEKELVNFIMQFLLRRDGPIHKFELFTSYLKSSTDLEQWLLFLSKKDLKELDLNVYRHNWWCEDHRFRTPSCIFSCQKLTALKLFWFELKPPLGFQGFTCLTYLDLAGGPFTLEVIEDLISGCPLLEKFIFANTFDHLALTVRAPNLKHLNLGGGFKDVYLEHTPLLVAISMDFFSEAWWEGNVLTKVPVTYDCLKFIELRGINFEEMNKVSYVLHLILQSPNLQELEISASEIESSHYKDADLDFWEKECPTDFTFKHLKIVEMSGVSNENGMKFLNFLLGRSPVLEVMSISPDEDCTGKMNMANEVLHFRQASPKVDIKFFD